MSDGETKETEPIQENETEFTIDAIEAGEHNSIRTFWECKPCEAQLHIDILLIGGAEAHSVWCERCNRPMDPSAKPVETNFSSVALEYSTYREKG